MKRNIIAFLVLFTIVAIVAGCSSGDITGPGDIKFPLSNVSFAQHVQPLFTVSCNYTGCHNSPRSDNKFTDLTSWGGVRAINVVNQPGDTSCGLLQVVYGREFHNGPLNLDSNHVRGLKTWVLEGAQNN